MNEQPEPLKIFTDDEFKTKCVCGRVLEDHNRDLKCPIPYDPESPYAFGDDIYNPVSACLGFMVKLSIYEKTQKEYLASL